MQPYLMRYKNESMLAITYSLFPVVLVSTLYSIIVLMQ